MAIHSCQLLAFKLFVLLRLSQVLAVVPASPPPPVGNCPADSAGGYLWPATSPGTQMTAPCDSASLRFVSQLNPELRRYCSSNGTWSDVDYTGCTLTQPAVPFLLIWYTLQTNNVSEVTRNGPTLELQESRLLDTISVPYTVVKMAVALLSPYGMSVTFDVALNTTELDKPGMADRLNAALTTLAPSNFSGYSVLPQGQAHVMVIPAVSCQCQQSSGTQIVRLCSGTVMPPCLCVMGLCQCQNIYVGNGVYCTVDFDGDGYPDQPLGSCTSGSNLTYCTKDVCPQVYNPNQNSSDCQSIPGYFGCAYGQDPLWSVFWGNTPYGSVSMQRCPNGPGFATRACRNTGWDSPNLSTCQSFSFGIIATQAMSGFFNSANMSLNTLLQQAKSITRSLLQLSAIPSSPKSSSLLPLDLNLTNYIIKTTIGWLDTSLRSTLNSTDLPTMNILELFNNILHSTNLQGWLQLQQVNFGSQLLLDNAEKFALYLANAQTDNQLQVFGRLNIALGANRVNHTNGKDYTFPQSSANLTNFTTSEILPAQITIPSALISERAQGNTVPVTGILFRNMESVLPLNSSNTSIASMVISAQVMQQEGTSVALQKTPATIKFTFNSSAYNSTSAKYSCVFWQSNSNITSSSFWSMEGLSTIYTTTSDDGMTEVMCESTHLSSFAILVDVSGTSSSNTNTSKSDIIENEALSVVSYIGCAISILSLAVAVVFFLSLGKSLLTTVNNFIHLNLSISLLISYLIFAVGVETATSSLAGCIFVATLLHYFLLASFCWMLCEGIMLFLLLVVVFSTTAKKWWAFLILGWGLPLPAVVVSVAVRYSEYGIRDSSGNLIACWLPTSSGVIFAFVGPMLLIIAVNVIFLIVALGIIFKQKKSKSITSAKQFWTLMTATVVLLPLLGLTWVFGLLAVNQNTTVFAWLFTIFNSLQGLFVLIFHVLRNEKFHKTAFYKCITGLFKPKKVDPSRSSISTIKVLQKEIDMSRKLSSITSSIALKSTDLWSK